MEEGANILRERAGGRAIRTVVPRPNSLSAEISPPIPVTMLWLIASPKPVPVPFDFVVKKGVEDAVEHGWRDARSVVTHFDDGPTRGVCPRDDANLIGIGLPVRKSVRGIQQKIDEHLPQPRIIRPDERYWSVVFHESRTGVFSNRQGDRELNHWRKIEDAGSIFFDS
jgi:hypothetical protein